MSKKNVVKFNRIFGKENSRIYEIALEPFVRSLRFRKWNTEAVNRQKERRIKVLEIVIRKRIRVN